MSIKSIIPSLKRRVKRKPVIVTGLVTAIALCAVVAFLFQQIDARAQVDDERHADAIIVLGAAVPYASGE